MPEKQLKLRNNILTQRVELLLFTATLGSDVSCRRHVGGIPRCSNVAFQKCCAWNYTPDENTWTTDKIGKTICRYLHFKSHLSH